MTIYTVQLAKWRLVDELGFKLLDITVKSGDKRLAPHPQDLWDYKSGKIDESEYSLRYYAKLRGEFSNNPRMFESLMQDNVNLVLACYCRSGKFCHRHLLVRFLEWLADENEHPISYAGEIGDESYDPSAFDRYISHG